MRPASWPFPARFFLLALALSLTLPLTSQAQLGPPGYGLLLGLSGTPQDTRGSAVAVGDFNGDGLDDLVVGAPGANNGQQFGRVSYHLGSIYGFGSQGSFTASFVGSTMENGARFGAAVAAGDFNGDGLDDLAIGAPGQIVNGDDNAGQVVIIYANGTTFDFAGAHEFSQANLAGAVESGDAFGFSLATGDLNGDGVDDLAVGVPMEDVFASGFGQRNDAGAVNVIYGVLGVGLTTADNLILHQEVPGVTFNANHDDRFGYSLAIGDFSGDFSPDLAVGIPGEFRIASDNAGMVEIFIGGDNGIDVFEEERFLSQADSEVTGSPDEDDEFGYSLTTGDFDGNLRLDLAVGVPGEAFFVSAPESGTVQVFFGAINGLTTNDIVLYEGFSGDIGANVQSFDRFGEALAAGDFDDDGHDDLAMGAPLDNWLGVINAGNVVVVYGDSSGFDNSRGQAFNLDTLGTATIGDEFGFALAAGRFDQTTGGDDLAVGIPNLEVSGDFQRGAVGVVRSQFPFSDGFETGGTSRWSQAVPVIP